MLSPHIYVLVCLHIRVDYIKYVYIYEGLSMDICLGICIHSICTYLYEHIDMSVSMCACACASTSKFAQVFV